MLGREALFLILQFSQVMAEKRAEPLLQVQGWENGLIAIAVARSYSRIICGARVPSLLWEREPDWDPESGIKFAC